MRGKTISLLKSVKRLMNPSKIIFVVNPLKKVGLCTFYDLVVEFTNFFLCFYKNFFSFFCCGVVNALFSFDNFFIFGKKIVLMHCMEDGVNCSWAENISVVFQFFDDVYSTYFLLGSVVEDVYSNEARI